jgi:protein-disulfide isomerase
MSDLRSAPVPSLQEHDHVRGDPRAPLVIVYGEFTCPFCALAHERLHASPVRVVFRHFVLKSKPHALALARAVEAAAGQGAFWEMHDALFADPARSDDPHLWAHATRLGLDLDRFQVDRRGAAGLQRVQEDTRAAMRGGVASTPTLFLDGVAHPGPPTPELVAALVR